MHLKPAPLRALTGVRFFAASWVVLYHGIYLAGDDIPALLRRIASGGPLAVSFFFVLSGFILTYAYADADSLGLNYRAFFVNRFARIYPVYVLSFFADAPRAILYFFGTAEPVEAILKSVVAATAYLTLTQSWLPRMASAWNAPGWSLSAEVFFYILFPFIVGLSYRLHSRRRLILALLVVYVTSLVFNTSATVIGTAGANWLLPFFKRFPPLCLGDFVIGVLTARLVSLAPATRRVQTNTASTAISIGGVLAVMCIVLNTRDAESLWLHAALCPIFAVVIAALAQDGNLLARVLSWRPFMLLGAASYAIYLLHQPLLTFVIAIVGAERGIMIFAIYAVIVVVASIGVYWFIEEPSRKFVRRRFNAP